MVRAHPSRSHAPLVPQGKRKGWAAVIKRTQDGRVKRPLQDESEIEARRTGRELRGHFEKEVHGQEEEDEVGGPGGQEGGELADATHRFGEGGEGPVGDADADAKGEPTNGATAADEESEGDREHHADGSDERVGNFFVPLNRER